MLVNLKRRSYEKELLDESDIPKKALFQNLGELDFINRHLGGYRASLLGLEEILKEKNGIRNVLDIGFGGGDSIKQMANLRSRGYPDLFFYGVDYKQDCIEYAQRNLSGTLNLKLICSDYRQISNELLETIDVIHCSLFLHHLEDEEIIELFRFCKTHNCIILVNDLHRNAMAYHSIKLLSLLFSRSELVKNDAPLSVRRGFKRKELVSLLKESGYSNFSVEWCWAFRFKLIAYS